MSKQPFLPLFFGDFLASTAEWSGEEASLYLTLLGHQWTLGTLPADPAKLARLVRWDRKAFDKCWPQVSAKFLERDGRLINDRLEQHRAKAEEMAEKNRTSGRKGAEARWRKDGERHGDPMASAIKPLCHPSHPIPSHESPSRSSPDSHLSATPRERASEIVSRGTNFAEFRAAYPEGTYPESAWLLGERAYLRCVGEELPHAELMTLVRAYAEQQRAKGSLGTQFVRTPANFFADQFWRGPFPLPKTKAQAAQDANVDAGLAWLQQQETADAAR